jgi:hypothetical protein
MNFLVHAGKKTAGQKLPGWIGRIKIFKQNTKITLVPILKS